MKIERALEDRIYDQTGLIRAAENLLDFVSVRSGEDVLITTDTSTDQVSTIFTMAERLGAHPAILTTPQLPFQGTSDPYISRELTKVSQSCDVWIDLTFPYIVVSHVHDKAMETKQVRYILAGDVGRDSFARLFETVVHEFYER